MKEEAVEASIEGEFLTNSAGETFDLGRRIGERAIGRSIFLLSGDLGAGKTVFAKGLAAGLGIDPRDVTSPSFTLINVHEGRLPFYHIDLYRLESDSEIQLGLDEILESEAVIAIEWAERLISPPGDAVEVRIEYLGESERRLTIQKSSSRR
ncbi:MAG TPA: tRNA (adenosine(37)-N6)-threonylcarbamoyltransferase complex ATPase subunit type 1 TsaE [Blastocatellia bacterium]|nr:tRNA (adenosine(37)-N6)-threonylcarbamoyltransferase complex ATPase subunit type 1 TsaE [Blastocatellia bacterium]